MYDWPITTCSTSWKILVRLLIIGLNSPLKKWDVLDCQVRLVVLFGGGGGVGLVNITWIE